MKNKFIYLAVAFLLFQFLSIAQNGQEVLVELESMPASKSVQTKNIIRSGIELPFFDDFSYGTDYPLVSNWLPSSIFINTNYDINAPTVGVATFDAINNEGNLHNTSTLPFIADSLTSLPINLSNSNNIFFSFKYQPQGMGSQPSVKDSLILEFYNPTLQQWRLVWSASADFTYKKIKEKNHLLGTIKEVSAQQLKDSFFLVIFPITSNEFLTNNFQFRFRNYASITSNTQIPSIRGNGDHWNIDLVYLNKNRTYQDTYFDDIAYTKPLKSFFNNYATFPWKHFNEQAQQAEINNEMGIDELGFTVSYRNLGPTTWNITRQFSIENQSTQEIYSFTGGAENVYAYTDITYTRDFFYNFSSLWIDSAHFTYTSFLYPEIINPNTKYLRWNDTLRYEQKMTNYYAYDDGTAESGYGLYGEGTQNGKVAVKFTNFKADTLVGVYMYFNRIVHDPNNPNRYFKLAVWDDNNGKPGQLIYEQENVKPLFTNELNRFVLFQLDEPLRIEAGTFYIGYIQITTDMLNHGFDLNRVNNNKIFYNISGSWVNSQFQGSLMIRPVFDALTEPPTPSTTPFTERNTEISIFPNPTSESFKISISELNNEITVQIFNISGQLIGQQKNNGETINVSHLPNGIYMVKVTLSSGFQKTQKLIISR